MAAAVVRYGIVGVGMMGREHLHNLAHLAGQVEREQSVRIRVTCLADPHPESLLLGLRLAAELGLPAPQVPDIIDNAYVIIEFDNGCRGMLDLCMFAEGSKNEQEISVVGDIGKGEAFVPESIVRVGKRAGGRDGVETIKAEDDRIKYQGLHHGSSYLEHLNFLFAIKAQGACSPTINLNDGLLSIAIGLAGQLSIEKSRFVTIDKVLSSC